MSVEIALPFRLSPDGSIAAEENPDKQISQHIQSLVGTQPSERVVLTTYGVPLAHMIFEPEDTIATQEIRDLVEEALNRWEPGAFLRSVTPIVDPRTEGIAVVNVNFLRTDAAGSPGEIARNVNTAMIRIGGEVREIVRG